MYIKVSVWIKLSVFKLFLDKFSHIVTESMPPSGGINQVLNQGLKCLIKSSRAVMVHRVNPCLIEFPKCSYGSW